MRSRVPKPTSLAITSIECRLSSNISLATSMRKFSIALAGDKPVSPWNARLNWRGLRRAASASFSTVNWPFRLHRADRDEMRLALPMRQRWRPRQRRHAAWAPQAVFATTRPPHEGDDAMKLPRRHCCRSRCIALTSSLHSVNIDRRSRPMTSRSAACSCGQLHLSIEGEPRASPCATAWSVSAAPAR
jgi:hypothetical protein